MKKIIIYIILLGVLLIPGSIKAEEKSKVNVYLFWGSGCPHCHDFLSFMNDISPEYMEYFELVGFEVWYNDANGKVMQEVADYLDKEVGGVPFIVIGQKTFAGYSSGYDQEIKDLLVELYNDANRYDVLEKMGKKLKDYSGYLGLEETLKLDKIDPKVVDGVVVSGSTSKNESAGSDNSVSWMIVLTVISLVTMIIKTNHDKKIILAVLKTKK